jgi:hypothetical protein
METTEQLRKNLALVAHPPLSIDERGWVDKLLPQVPADLLNPDLW